MTFSLVGKSVLYTQQEASDLLNTNIMFNSSSSVQCTMFCSLTIPQCRTFAFDSSILQCQLFASDMTTGNVIYSPSSPNSLVGTVQLASDMFTDYGQPCYQNKDNSF
ncbi:unnamed protein product [Rotaria socialis]|nr:unnamed protein product [Rotaria socialis]CAF3674375.1 unnamed protein product [Rotaria socialis]